MGESLQLINGEGFGDEDVRFILNYFKALKWKEFGK
jgi:hypothetical protein